jgi:hypothetical protein
MDLLQANCLLIVAIYVLLETNALVEYASLLRKIIKKDFFKLDAFYEYRMMTKGLSDYATFLLTKYPSFWVKLATCPTCLLVWGNGIYALLNEDFSKFLMAVFFSWIGYYTLSGLIKLNDWLSSSGGHE